MIGTFIAIVVAIVIGYHPYGAGTNISLVSVDTFMIAAATLFLFFVPVGIMLAWLPMQKAEQNSTPFILEMLPKDRFLRLNSVYLVAFPLLTLLVIIHLINYPILLPVWIVFLGFAIDAARHFASRIMAFLNPFLVMGMFAKKAAKSIEKDREIDLCHWIDGLSEISIKGIQRQSTSVTHQALSEEQNIIRIFLDASKSFSHPEQDKQTKALGITDKVSYVMFYLYQRLDVVFSKALRNNLEMTCSYIITILGKISIDAAKYDISMASPPLRFLGKFAKRAADNGFEETSLTASCVFFEVARSLLSDIDITYSDIKDPFLSIINGMEHLSKGSFQRDKNINLDLLIQPFKDLRALFDQGKAKEHQDRAVIVQNIDRVLGEFEALQLVLHTMPKIPPVVEEAPPLTTTP